MVAMAEVKSVMPQAHAKASHGLADAHRSDYRPDEHTNPDYDAPRGGGTLTSP
jgi:hypothetical protein